MGDSAKAITAELLATRDGSDPDRIHELAALGTHEAFEGLAEVYEGVGSLFMRREIVRALVSFDGGEASEPALEFVANVATQATEPELREAAIDALVVCETHGKLFLRKIVDSPADNIVRELALEAHLTRAEDSDRDWYRNLYRPPAPTEEEIEERKKKKKLDRVKEKRGQEVEVEVRVPLIGELRILAFKHLVETLTVPELVQALSDGAAPIRAGALQELERRGDERVPSFAQRMFEHLQEHPDNRAAAAGVIARAGGAEVADEFIEMAVKVLTPHVTRNEIADLLRAMDDPDVEKKLMRRFGKGKRHQKLFYLRATKDSEDPKYTDKVAKLARDKDPEVAMAACAVLGERGDPAALPGLRKLVDKSKSVFVRRAALEALTTLSTGPSEFTREELEGFLESTDVAVRNLAVRELGRDPANASMLLERLEDEEWSTRVAALECLVAFRSAEYVPAILDRMSRERGRFVELFADALWRLSGQPFETSLPRWQAWWEREGAAFEPIDPERLAELEEQREERRLREVSQVEKEFFGIEIVSERVVFVLDISRSMGAPMRRTSVGAGQSRLSVARKRLKRAIDSLEPTALFNVIVFDSGLMTWNDGIVEALDENKGEAREWVDRLGLGSATNLYGALHRAFEDPDVDTIFVVSDGEPAGGEKDDPYEIREDVATWNAQRGIVIHTITVGGRLQILQWLAEDSHGSHVRLQ